ncbi:7949_t:CDS:2 [Funneliformis geosporum]|uniref:7949_t:CDS:1 n=1 Tax=Funneliformis geosporum TaxID=1117311 RepID=A0A9W4T8I9_9GLOM|nr:7949_t:CDS:2 [Funneliformis geosporum]
MESERSNSIAPQTPLSNEEDFFESDYRSITNHENQAKSVTCSWCKEPDPLFETNGTNLKPVTRLSYLHSFHLRCIIISLKKDMTCPHCQHLIYLGDNDDAKLNPREDDNVKKFFKELTNRPQDFNPLPEVSDVETDPTTPEMIFVGLHDKILHAEKILNKKTREVSRVEYEILDSYYPLGEALEKKLAEYTSIHPTQTARVLLNAEIWRISPSSFGKFTDKEIKVIQERIRTNSSRPNWLDQFDDLELNEPMLTD